MADRLLGGPTRRLPQRQPTRLIEAQPPQQLGPLQALGPLGATTSDPIVFKRGDTWPPRSFTLQRNGTAWDTTDAISGILLMQKRDSVDPIIDRPISFDTPRSGGEVTVQFEVGDTDIEGTYDCEFELVYADGPMTFPNQGYFTIIIEPDIGDTP
jgi:hypothetical protein